MRSLSSELGATVILSVIFNRIAYCLERVEYEKGIIYSMQRGAHLPLHSGASAKILLAFLSDREIEEFMKEADLIRFTKNTITDPNKLRKNLKEIKKNGYAYTDQEVDIGARAIAAPIFNIEGRIIAAISVAGPIHQFDKKNLQRMKRKVIDYAKKITGELTKER
jgi:DNA-binding IclR family transcriptional regulator